MEFQLPPRTIIDGIAHTETKGEISSEMEKEIQNVALFKFIERTTLMILHPTIRQVGYIRQLKAQLKTCLKHKLEAQASFNKKDK